MNRVQTSGSCRRALSALAAEVFGAGVAVGVAEVATADIADLHATEHAAIRGAIRARQSEFAAGRAAARGALGRAVAIPMAADRAPIWPQGTQGSITHAGGWALAVAAPFGHLVGIDLECDAPLPPDTLDTILLPSERAWIATQPDALNWARVIFSAKECAYKAQYARSECLFGFEVFDITVKPDAGQFTATFQQDIAPFQAGEGLRGRFSCKGGFVLTGILC